MRVGPSDAVMKELLYNRRPKMNSAYNPVPSENLYKTWGERRGLPMNRPRITNPTGGMFAPRAKRPYFNFTVPGAR
jgi:hypothetical protein